MKLVEMGVGGVCRDRPSQTVSVCLPPSLPFGGGGRRVREERSAWWWKARPRPPTWGGGRAGRPVPFLCYYGAFSKMLVEYRDEAV